MTPTQASIGTVHTAIMGRDAIHIAVYQIVACEPLQPGQHIGLDDRGCARVGRSATGPVGIVDPFLTEPVQVGQKVWLFLYPNTITELRHEWVHPQIANASPGRASDALGSRSQAIQAIADAVGLSYSRTIAAMSNWAEYQETEGLGYDIDYPDSAVVAQAWRDWERLMGQTLPEEAKERYGNRTDAPFPFSCSC